MGRSVPGAKAPVASHDNMRPAPGRKAPGGVPGCVPPLYISLASPAPAHPPLLGGIPQVAGRHTGALTQLRPHDRVDRPPRRLPRVPTASPRPALTAVPARRGPPPSPLGTRALHGGRGRLRFRGEYPPVPPECPPHSARQGALRAPTTKNSAPHEGRGELPPIAIPAPSGRIPRSVRRRQRGPSPAIARTAHSPANAIASGCARARGRAARTGACVRDRAPVHGEQVLHVHGRTAWSTGISRRPRRSQPAATWRRQRRPPGAAPRSGDSCPRRSPRAGPARGRPCGTFPRDRQIGRPQAPARASGTAKSPRTWPISGFPGLPV